MIFFALWVILSILAGGWLVVYLTRNSVRYCRKHQQFMTPHGYDDCYRCDQCWEEDIKQMRQRIEEGKIK